MQENPAKRHHGDLRERAQKAAAGSSITVRWVKSHLTEREAVKRGWTCAQWAGNQAADVLAGAGAAQHAVSEPEVQEYLRAIDKVEHIQR